MVSEEEQAPITDNGGDGSDSDTCCRWKIHISRVPTAFTEATVHRILTEKLQQQQQQQKEKSPTNDETMTTTTTTIPASSIVVELIYPRDSNNGDHCNNNDGADGGHDNEQRASNKSKKKVTKDEHQEDTSTPDNEHRGFGFVSFATEELQQAALDLRYVKGGRKVTSKRQHTFYLRPYIDEDEQQHVVMNTNNDTDASTKNGNIASNENGHISQDYTGSGGTVHRNKNQCYLWSLFRCPYGSNCKFDHVGDGGCVTTPSPNEDTTEQNDSKKNKKKGKCFEYKKTGKCRRGDECPFSHDFEPKTKSSKLPSSSCTVITETVDKNVNDDEKTKITDSSSGRTSSTHESGTSNGNTIPQKVQRDCINWKTHGKCRKIETCPYRHDPVLQQKALEKKQKKKGKVSSSSATEHLGNNKTKQPLSVRVFGLNYETTQSDVRDFFAECGTITDVVFPTFEDSGRSKGYCCVWFASPKASAAALQLDGSELHGRWLRIQSGKMMREWDDIHTKNYHNNKKQKTQTPVE